MKEKLNQIRQEAFALLESENVSVEEVRIKYLGKKGRTHLSSSYDGTIVARRKTCYGSAC